MVSDARLVADVAHALTASVQSEDPKKVTIERPQGLNELRAAVAGELRKGAQELLVLVLGVGLALVSITMYGAIAARKRDFGRRRALGASRSSIVVLVLIQAGVAGAIGAITGCAAGLVLMAQTSGLTPGIGFLFGVVGLALVTAAIGALPPALSAALADPVRIVRVP